MTRRIDLAFATGNPGKLVGARAALQPLGIDLIHAPITDLAEIQADFSEEVAEYKVKQAYAQRQSPTPVMCNDSSFHIQALGGFPRTYVSPVTRDIGLEGYLRLMSAWPDGESRLCTFRDAWAVAVPLPYPLEGAEVKVFSREIGGRLALSVRGHDLGEAKSPLWKLFIPDGSDLTLAEMDSEELLRHRASAADVYKQVADFVRQW